ncbi:MAG: heat-inducible transcriptional repressor HrcA [Elusimicrobiota bacterium]|jgi:heat-inducible transcriptional repressor|nr:heat-inducible transcriptional repressor HrcA [Elusimicrobiota bacterium]
MRQVLPSIIQERKSKILGAVIHQYVKTAKPVGSDIIIDAYDIKLSPATVRNLMAELEEEGFLTHPHTSAGRIPTDKGYRAYVDSIRQIQDVAVEEEERIKREYEQKKNEIETVLSETSKILSVLSQYTGFVTAPKTELDLIKNVELLQIGADDILIILITNTGMVKQMRAGVSLNPSQINRLRNFLNENLRGIPLSEAASRMSKEINDFWQSETEILDFARALCGIFNSIENDIYIGGASNAAEIAALNDFSDFDAFKTLIKFNDDKRKLIEIVDKNLNFDGINVKIGSEFLSDELKDLSIVTTSYNDGEKAIGLLGIVGPKRMEYDKMMSLVSGISKALNEFLRNKIG